MKLGKAAALTLFAGSAWAQIAPSQFVEGAFNGTWAITSNNAPTIAGTITFRTIDPAGAPALLNSLGEPNFVILNCPGAGQKREFYSAVYDFEGGGQIYACTNGTRLLGRYAAYEGGRRGFLEIFTTTAGANPTWRGGVLEDGGDGNFDNLNATYQGGGIATPLAQVRRDVINLLSGDPAFGSTLPSDSFQTLNATVEFDLETGISGFVKLVALDGARVIQESARLPVQAANPLQQSQLTVSGVRIPIGIGQIQLRADLLAANGSLILSSLLASYNYGTLQSQLSVAPGRLVFASRLATPDRIEQTVLITKTGSGTSVPITTALKLGNPWIASVTLSSNQVSNAEPVLMTVAVNPLGLAGSVYFDAVRITSPLGVLEVPITLAVSAQGPLLFLTKTGLRFEVRQGQGASNAGNVGVRNLGDSGSAVNWSARLLSGASLVTLTPTSGTSQPGGGSNLAVNVSPTGTNTLGPNYALIEVSDPNALNSPQYLSVVVDVSGANTPTIPLPSPAGFFFTGVQGQGQLTSQALSVFVSRTDQATYVASSLTNTGGGWLSLSSNGGVASTANPGRVNVQVTTADLAPGVYRGVVTIGVGPTQRSSKVTLLVQQPTAAADARGRAAGACTPTQAAIVETSLIANFNVPTAFPANLVARMFDDCGTARGDGSVVAAFSNGDPPLSLTADGRTADYSTTWVPSVAAATTTVTLTGTLPGLTPSTQIITGGVNLNAAPPPVIAPGGFIHNLYPVLGGPQAPGNVTQVFGDNFTTAAESAASVPLPTNLRGVEVLIGPRSAPIYFASKNQLTIQIPAELQGRNYSSVVLANGIPSVPEPVNMAAMQPGTVAFSDGRLVAQHPDFTLVTPDSPARPGEVLTIYLVGMGATTPPVPSGTASPGNPLAMANVQPQVTIDGKTAEIFFAGLTPGGVGLYQINLRVPPNTNTGLVDVVITQAGVRANGTKLVVAP